MKPNVPPPLVINKVKLSFYAILLLVVLTKMCILAIKVYIGFVVVFVRTIIINRVMVGHKYCHGHVNDSNDVIYHGLGNSKKNFRILSALVVREKNPCITQYFLCVLRHYHSKYIKINPYFRVKCNYRYFMHSYYNKHQKQLMILG